ncbi:MAG: 23S rRNA (guanosine(2251)-2'-O)-methyltransferase RlmB [bacterium]
MSTDNVIYGINSVRAALESDRPIEKILISKTSPKGRYSSLIALAKQRKTTLQFVPSEAISRRAKTDKHQGILALIGGVPLLSLEELLGLIKPIDEPAILAMLDGIEDPHNLGAIIRSAEAAGLSGLILPQHRSAPLSPIVSSTSSGAIYHLPIARVTNLAQSVERLKKEGFWIVGSAERGSKPFWDLPGDLPLVVIIGNEGRGIHRLVKEKCDYLITIPMYGKTPSLNASVAAALLFYEIRRKRESAISLHHDD